MEEKETVCESAGSTPLFDIAMVAGKSPEEIDRYAREYTDSVARYVKETVAEEISGSVADLEQREKEAELAAARAALLSNDDLYDFSKRSGEVDSLVAAIPGMKELPPESAMTLCYLMIKGAEAVRDFKNPKVETPEEIAEKIYERADVMKILAERRAKDAPDELPVVVKSGGSAVNIKPKPKTLADARTSAEKHFKI